MLHNFSSLLGIPPVAFVNAPVEPVEPAKAVEPNKPAKEVEPVGPAEPAGLFPNGGDMGDMGKLLRS